MIRRTEIIAYHTLLLDRNLITTTMIASSARTVRPLARQALRQNAAIKSSSSATLLSASQRRMASSDTAKGAIEKAAKSDAPWAIGSLVVFGSMFIYLTSPPKGGKHGHGHENEQHEESDDDSDTLIDAENTTYDNPNKIELKPGKNSPAGGQVSDCQVDEVRLLGLYRI